MNLLSPKFFFPAKCCKRALRQNPKRNFGSDPKFIRWLYTSQAQLSIQLSTYLYVDHNTYRVAVLVQHQEIIYGALYTLGKFYICVNIISVLDGLTAFGALFQIYSI